MKYFKKINKVLEMPKEAYTNEPKIVITGFNELYIENYKGILEYNECFIKLCTYIGNIELHGINFKLDRLKEDSLKIYGKIESFEFERMID